LTRFIHSGDWHLGMTRRFLSGEAQARYAEGRLDAVRAIAALARTESCEFVVVSGDVFDSNHLDRQIVVRALDAMATFDVPLYLLPGNHDPANSASVYQSPTFRRHCPPNVIVLQAGEPIVVPGTAVEVIGAPWASKQPLEDLVMRACDLLGGDTAALRVLVAHGAVDSLSPHTDDPALIGLAKAEETIALGRLHYLALGDRHSLTQVGSTGRIWYSGTPLVTNFIETNPNQVLIVDLDGQQISVEPHRVGCWAFIKRAFDVNGRADVDDVGTWLDGLANKRDTVIRLSFLGTLSLGEMAYLEEVLDHARDLFAALDTWERSTDLAVLPDDSDLQELGLAGFASEALEDLRGLASNGHENGLVAGEALGLLYRLAGAGR
jgi:DNA repair exonuclease SbcCD nuclease subunit